MKTFLHFFIGLLLISCTSQRPPVTHFPSSPITTTRTVAISSSAYPSFLNNYARLFLHTLAQEIPLCSIPRNYIPSENLMRKFPVTMFKDSVYCISGFFKVEKGFPMERLTRMCICYVAGDEPYCTAYVPLYELCDFLKLKGIIRFELTRRTESMLNVARPAVNAQVLLDPPSQSTPYSGKGVIVGIVDYGFDYTHPDFYDLKGSEYRILRVWEQTHSGTPPPGFEYGRELIGEEAIVAAETDTKTQTHGTHVTGIAAGSGAGTIYYGLAPESELVLVSTDRTDVGIADGLKYIADYATSQNKPCVINFSLGSSIGPHDGTSSFDLLCERRSRAGLLFTGSAGNNGNQNIYLGYSFTGLPDTLIKSVIVPNPSEMQMIADIWGNPDNHYATSISLIDTLTLTEIGNTPFVDTSDSSVYTFQINVDSTIAIVQIAAEKGDHNKKPTLMVQIDLTDPLPPSVVPLLNISATTSAQINCWLTGGQFSNIAQSAPYLAGNTSHTIGEIGGTGKKIISVGAFCTKNEWEGVDGKMYEYGPLAIEGEIAYFSSRGPTADGRIKPDIITPGYGVVSAFSHYFTGAYPPLFYRTTKYFFNNELYYWGILQGTSEAAPIITGTLALWLQKYPQLTFEEAIQAIRQTATPAGSEPLPNNTWGWGVLNAAKGLSVLENP